MNVRSSACVLSFLLAAAFLFLLGCLCAIVFLVDRDCGARFGYDSCQIPERP
jgi:hypothetical protein